MTTPPAPADQAAGSDRLGGAARTLALAAALWIGVLGGLAAGRHARLVLMAAIVVAVVVGVTCWLGGRGGRRVALVLLMCVVAGAASGAVRAHLARDGPVAALAARGAYVEIQGVVSTDPVRRDGVATGDRPVQARVVLDLRVDRVTGRGQTHEVRAGVVVVARHDSWATLLPGQPVRVSGRLAAVDGWGPEAALLRVDAPARPSGGPGLAGRATEPLRAGLREAVSGVAQPAQGLVPALVAGDESALTEQLREDMKATGLAHLTAVSGTNVTIVLVMVLGVARWARVRGYALPAVGALAVVGFVLLARPEPSVVRAAVMGVVGVLGVLLAGRRRGPGALATAVCVLLLVDPWLAVSVGFVLSVLATGAILFLVPSWQRALWWLPGPVAGAVAVTLAAQLACAPVVLAISGVASLASLPANLAAAPAVVPATVFGVLAAAVAPLSDLVAGAFGWLAGLAAAWIVRVAAWGAALPGAVVGWPGGGVGMAGAVVGVGLAVVFVPRLLRRPVVSLACAVALVLSLTRAVPTPGWPPARWLAVACDVGQGDALALRAGERAAVVVDAGPEPRAVQRCLDSLDVDEVPVLVLTHFHADHVLGLPGVLAGRRVEQVLVSPLAEPAANAAQVSRWLRAARVPSAVAAAGSALDVGPDLHVEVVWPRRLIRSEESAPNNASVVLSVVTGGVRFVLTGDIEPTAQAALLAAEPALRADVLKVPHHGSPHQHAAFLDALDAELALVSVGDNDYGHPAGNVMATLRRDGADVWRTDEHGAIAVVRMPDGGLGVVPGGPRARPS